MYSICIAARTRRSGEIDEDQTVHIGMLVRPLSLSLCSVALAQEGGGVGVAEDKEVIALPSRLTRGINLNYLFGGLDYYFFTNQNPYNAGRFYELFHGDDFKMLRWIDYTSPSPSQPAFRHIRLPIEPYALGAKPDGTLKVGSTEDPGGMFAANRVALRNFIIDAAQHDLAVILDVHPTTITQLWLNDIYSSASGWNLGPSSNCPAWPGEWKFNWVTLASPSSETVESNHPLREFWKWFSMEIKSWSQDTNLTGHELINPDYIYLELMNEPLEGLTAANTGQPPLLFPSNVETYRADWWRLQASVINDIHDSIRLPEFLVIASTYAGDVREVDGMRSDVTQPQTQRPADFPYGGPDAPRGWVPVVGHRKVVYTTHIYTPFRFTHTQDSFYENLLNGDDDPHYIKNRDFLHNIVNQGTDDPQGIGYPEDDNRQVPIDRSIKYMIADINKWSNGCIDIIPPIMITEFGAKERMIPLNLPPGAPPPGGGGGGIDRPNYYSDVRIALETNGFGWSAFNMCGSFPIFAGSLWSNSSIHQRPLTSRTWLLNMKEALILGW